MLETDSSLALFIVNAGFFVVFLLLFSTALSAVELSGQYSNLLFQTRDSFGHSRTTDLNRLRLQLDGEINIEWGAEQPSLRVHVVYDHELLWGAMVADPLVSAALRRPDSTWLDAAAVLSGRQNSHWKHALYRGWLAYDVDDFTVKVGRQRIAWGSGRIWNPTDRFNPVQPTALELDQKLGVDAAALQWNYSASASLSAVASPSSIANGTVQKMAFRWQDTWGAFDLSMMVARIADESMLGLDVTGNAGDAGVRFEWMQARNVREGSYGQMIFGLDYTWNNRWFANGLYTAIEYFYNGAAGLVVSKDRVSGISNQLLGMQLAYDLTPLWRAEMLFILDMQTPSSWFAVPSVTWSFEENIDLQCVVQLPQGNRDGEFAGLEAVYSLRIDWYF